MKKVQNTSLRRDGYALIHLLTVAIDESLGDSSVVVEGVGEVTWTSK